MCWYKKLYLYNLLWFPFWFLNYCMSSLKAWLTFVGLWEASCHAAVHCLTHFSSGGSADVLAVVSCASPCGCRPGWPSASTKSSLVLVMAVSSLQPWQRWPLHGPRSLGEFLVLLFSSMCFMISMATSLHLGLYDNDLVMALICCLLGSIFIVITWHVV
jgi:hypothetical protein